jgi:hypothetical protein
VFLTDLPVGVKVFALYYAGVMENEELEKQLRKLGDNTGRNLFINMGRLSDPNFDFIETRFKITKFPVIIMTANDDLASPDGEYLTTYARLDSKLLLSAPDRAMECVEKLFLLFLQKKVADAISSAKWTQRAELLQILNGFFKSALGVVKEFVFERDISFSFLEGKLELKKHDD